MIPLIKLLATRVNIHQHKLFPLLKSLRMILLALFTSRHWHFHLSHEPLISLFVLLHSDVICAFLHQMDEAPHRGCQSQEGTLNYHIQAVLHMYEAHTYVAFTHLQIKNVCGLRGSCTYPAFIFEYRYVSGIFNDKSALHYSYWQKIHIYDLKIYSERNNKSPSGCLVAWMSDSMVGLENYADLGASKLDIGMVACITQWGCCFGSVTLLR